MPEQTIDRELVTKWIEALESGTYSQTKERLHDQRGYCCLGVLCNVVDPSAWTQRASGEFQIGDRWMILPDAIAERIGLDPNGEKPDYTAWDSLAQPENDDEDASSGLAYANDNGSSFTEIAAALREYYEIPKAVAS